MKKAPDLNDEIRGSVRVISPPSMDHTATPLHRAVVSRAPVTSQQTELDPLGLQLTEAQCLAILVRKHGWYWLGARLLSGRQERKESA